MVKQYVQILDLISDDIGKYGRTEVCNNYIW